jgi:hypothetical protein
MRPSGPLLVAMNNDTQESKDNERACNGNDTPGYSTKAPSLSTQR